LIYHEDNILFIIALFSLCTTVCCMYTFKKQMYACTSVKSWNNIQVKVGK